MESLWNDDEAQRYADDPLQMRVYTSRLLGREPDLVLHGGGNTSVKADATNLFGDSEELIYVKGSGWDLATIEAAGFAPVKLDVLVKMAALEELSDTDMVRMQRAAMTDPNAPGPSVEAILHAFIPYRYVDHTHADAVVTITNTDGGADKIRDIYGDRVLVVPYVMPGFVLAREIYKMTRDIDWKRLEGMILLNHGVFTFSDDARSAYENMIKLVTEAEDYLREKRAVVEVAPQAPKSDLLALSNIRRVVSDARGRAVIAQLDNNDNAVAFSNREDIDKIATRGPLTPDHVIRTKQIPMLIRDGAAADMTRYAHDYEEYFAVNGNADLTMLDPAPRWAVWPGHGVVSFGDNVKGARIVSDIKDHTLRAIQQAELLGGWQALPARDIFDVEYWELEQAKLKKSGAAPPFAGKVALVTGAASGIGKACADTLRASGAAVAALDIDPAVVDTYSSSDTVGIVCDITDTAAVDHAVAETVRRFGGLDIVIANAGFFPKSATIDSLDDDTWRRSIDVNLTGQRNILKSAIPFLENGVDPAVVVVASKNVPAPGPGASAYSVAKAGTTQLARVAALELAPKGIRVNVLHPNSVFDTAIWTDEVLEQRAAHYGVTVDEYKRNNLLATEVTSKDVAALACAMAGPLFAKTTGAQLPIDGGNERVI